ncbi:MAG: A24 family peptidase [Pseudomonadota bacterium]
MAHWVFYVTALVVGLVIGSYLNVVISRGPVNWGLIPAGNSHCSGPRSQCPSCGGGISAIDLIPIASYFLLRGKCRRCGDAISPRYPIVEGLGGIAFCVSAFVFGLGVEWALACAFAGMAIALAFIDFETTYLPDALTMPMLIGGIAVNTVDLFASWPEALLGAGLGYAVFEAIRRGYRAIRGRDGLGQGDSKLLSAIGAWVGASALPGVVFAASIGTLVIVAAQGRLSDQRAELPFGPGLAAAGLAALWLTAL